MLFNSAPFLFLFLPLAVMGYQVLTRFGRRSVLSWLVFASFVFYSWWDWHFFFVLATSVLINFSISRMIVRSQTAGPKKLWLYTGVAANLGALFYFKYVFHLLAFFTSMGLSHHEWKSVALPLGISFFTFTQIGYLVDLASGEAQPQNLLEYALFVSFFPHLIAGPILHHKEIMPQFLERKDARLNWDDVLQGFSWFVLGLAKKCILADSLSETVGNAFSPNAHIGVQGAWLGIVLYSLQLYFDFSGYSDMAIGLARMFSIHFPLNFNSPYKATCIVDYWQRFHMTLTRYLTLYLYNPMSLAVNRRRMAKGKKISRKAAKTIPGFTQMIMWPTIATMFLAGVWHGAGMQYVIFGLLHGVYLTVNNAWKLYRGEKDPRTMNVFLKVGYILLTYVCIMVAQVFFRADNTMAALHYLSDMAGRHGFSWHDGIFTPIHALRAIIGLAIVWFLPNTQEIMDHAGSAINSRWSGLFTWQPTWQWSLVISIVLFAAVLNMGVAATFLYFQF